MVYLLSASRSLGDFLQSIAQNQVIYALEKAEEQYRLVRAEKWDVQRHVLGDFRPMEPLKSLVFKPREALWCGGESMPAPELKERIVIGVKNCDLSALKIHDYIFLADPIDPYYAEARKKTILVSCDCSRPCPSCFCTVIGEQPFAKEGFDVNLSVGDNGILIETGSQRGEQLLQNVNYMLTQADAPMVEERNRRRQAVAQKVAEQAEAFGLGRVQNLQQAIKKSAEADWWKEFSEDCVECGACNFVCCTCHCFLLAHGRDAQTEGRRKQWDSCLYLNFARVAGGDNPRRHRVERLYNRFDKKFVFFPTVLGRYGCDGCGRCAEACTGQIDIRNVLKKALG